MAWSEKNLAPFAEGLVGRDEQRSAFVADGDQLEQNAGLGLILGGVGFEPQLSARHLRSLDEGLTDRPR
jgi:hypothetical protein